MCGRASAAAEEVEVYGLSVFGDLAEAPDFKAFGYVNVAAPKGGALSRDKLGTFNPLDAFIPCKCRMCHWLVCLGLDPGSLRGYPAFGVGVRC